MAYIGNSPGNIQRGRRAVYEFTATNAQTVFSGTDDNGISLDLQESFENDVYLNGSRLIFNDDYTIAGEVLTLTSAAAAGDILVIVTQDDIANVASYTKAETDARYINYDGDIVNGDLQISGEVDAGSLIVDTDVLVVDATNNRVGIGEASPTVPLHINSTATSMARFVGPNGGNLYITNDNTDIVTFQAASGDGIAFNTNGGGNERLRIDNNGNVGIGTDDPAKLLSLETSGDCGFSLRTTAANTNAEMWEITAGANASSNADLTFRSRNDDGTGGQEVLRLQYGGKVGIGTGNPSRKLSVHSDDSATGGNVLLVRNANSTAGSFINFIAGGNNAPAIGAKGNDIVFTHDGYSGNELVRIREDGRVGINASSPDFKFNVVGSTNYETVKLYYTETANVTQRLGIAGRNYENNDNIGIIAMYDDGSNCVVNIGGSFTAPDNIEFRTGSTSAVRMNVNPSGNLVVGNAGASFTSDRLQVESPSNEPVASFYRPRNTGGGGLVRFMSDVGGTQTIVAQVTSEGNFVTNGGINFGSTGGNVASKTLDDYEEGTWTPNLGIGTTTTNSFNGTYSIRNGRYIKVGNMVTLWFHIRLSNDGSNSGSVFIKSLPFVGSSVNSSIEGSTVNINYWSSLSNPVHPTGYVQTGRSQIIMIDGDTTTGVVAITNSDLSNNTQFYGNVTYFTA